MPSEKYYYSHTGADFENLKILGLCCDLKPSQNWPPTSLNQYLHLHGTQDQNLLAERYDTSGSTTRWTFAYRLNLPAIDNVFVEIDSANATTLGLAELSDSVVRFLSDSLPLNWNVLSPVSTPIWQGVVTSPSPWPPSFDTLKPVPTAQQPAPPPAPQPTQQPIQQTDGHSSPIGWIVGAVIFVGVLIAVARPVNPGVSGLSPGNLQQQPPAVQLPQPTPVPTKPPCPLGCTTNPGNICPFTVIKGMVKPGNQRLYYEPGHREYGQQNVNPGAGDRWFCTAQEAANNGFVPAP